jgi:hypothetical protein
MFGRFCCQGYEKVYSYYAIHSPNRQSKRGETCNTETMKFTTSSLCREKPEVTRQQIIFRHSTYRVCTGKTYDLLF